MRGLRKPVQPRLDWNPADGINDLGLGEEEIRLFPTFWSIRGGWVGKKGKFPEPNNSSDMFLAFYKNRLLRTFRPQNYRSSGFWLTIEDVNGDAFALGVWRVALIPPAVRRLRLLDQQEAGGDLSLLGDHADATSRRVVADYLQRQKRQLIRNWKWLAPDKSTSPNPLKVTPPRLGMVYPIYPRNNSIISKWV